MQSNDPNYRVPPFPAFPSTSRYVPLGSVQDALGRVCRSIDAREAISLVVGPPGTGKSLICGLLVDHYRTTHEVVVVGETPMENRAAFLRHLLHHLGADLTSVPDGDLQLALIDRVCGNESPEGGMLIIVDEAQSLPLDVLEAIRTVTNIMHEGEPRVFAVLCGGVKLDEMLVEASLESFTQRVATRCYLHPMNGEETGHYVKETIRNCGADPDETITDDAISAVHHACSGVPRLINQMLTQAIDCAEEADQAIITEQFIDQAWAQLQQLPSPMVEEPKIKGDSAPIEFGELDDSINFGEWEPTTEVHSIEAVETISETVVPNETQSFEATESEVEIAEPTQCGPSECGPNECKVGDCGPGQCRESSVTEEPAETAVDWIEESVATTADQVEQQLAQVVEPSAPTNAELFGQFDQEEEVEVGNAIASRAPATPEPPADLEAMLHQEIIGISSFQDDIPGLSIMTEMTEDESPIEEEPQEQVEDFISIVDEDQAGEPEQNEVPVLRVSGDDIEIREDPCRDDTDILVIEDELELRRVDAASRSDGKEQTISVDFQAMLARMRNGS